jgi:hypothetical protein
MVSSHHEVPQTDLRTMSVMRGNKTDQKVNRGINNEYCQPTFIVKFSPQSFQIEHILLHVTLVLLSIPAVHIQFKQMPEKNRLNAEGYHIFGLFIFTNFPFLSSRFLPKIITTVS